MRWKNGDHGYGIVTKTLHWLMAAAITAQFAIGYTMEASGHGRGRGRGRGGESGRGRGRGGEIDAFGDDVVLTAHVVLGLTILGLAIFRLGWRRLTPLPPWAETLSRGERGLAHVTERALYVLMFAIPLTGLFLVVSRDNDAVGLHIATHIAFFVVVAIHIGLVLKHQFLNRDGLLRRMTFSPRA